MSNDKKPKKAEAPKVHGARAGGGSDLASKLADPKKAPAAAGKKKK